MWRGELILEYKTRLFVLLLTPEENDLWIYFYLYILLFYKWGCTICYSLIEEKGSLFSKELHSFSHFPFTGSPSRQWELSIIHPLVLFSFFSLTNKKIKKKRAKDYIIYSQICYVLWLCPPMWRTHLKDRSRKS